MLLVFLLPQVIKIMREYERAVVFRLGRLLERSKGPGIVFIFSTTLALTTGGDSIPLSPIWVTFNTNPGNEGGEAPEIPADVREYARFSKIDGATYDRANEFLRDRTYITAREWAIARLCSDFRTETGVEMTKIGENLPERTRRRRSTRRARRSRTRSGRPARRSSTARCATSSPRRNSTT